MKKINIAYWIVTGLFAAFMLFSAVPDAIPTPEAVTFVTGLGYPEYIVQFLGYAKILGVIAILIPGFPRIREWAYAGLFFDLAGAVYSLIASAGFQPEMASFIVIFGFLFGSYFLLHKMESMKINHKTVLS